MPFLQAEAPESVPRRETIERLLSRKNGFNHGTRTISTLSQLSPEERSRTGLVKLGKTKKRIDGDPYGTLMYFAGNVSHHMDQTMDRVMLPLFEEFRTVHIQGNAEISQLRRFLEAVPKNANLRELARQYAHWDYEIVRDDEYELELSFRLGSRTVRLLQLKDLKKDDKTSYNKTQRAIAAESRVRALLDEEPMSIEIQQYMMVDMAMDKLEELPDKAPAVLRYLTPMRAAAQEKFWLQMTKAERDKMREKAACPGNDIGLDLLQKLRDKWPRRWNMGRFDCDFFRNYLRDQRAANEAWTLVEEDVFIATDADNNVVFANIEGLASILYGPKLLDLLFRAVDMWSFYVPVPAPESKRHVVDGYIRKLHPELDMTKANVQDLPNAKMAVAHYGCWASVGDPHGRVIYRTPDAKFSRCQYLGSAEELFPQFSRTVLRVASDIIRFMFKPLDPGHYQECREVFDNLPENLRVPTCDDNFLSLFALGINAYTQRHRDTNDIAGGLSGLFTLGRYTGGNLCIPQLGIKLKYMPGTCAIIRGDVMEHLVADYSGPRFFIVGTNHESCKRNAFRRMGRQPPLPLPPINSKTEEEERIERDRADHGFDYNSDDPYDEEYHDYDVETTCINYGHEVDDPDIEVTNKWLHGPGALDWFEPSPFLHDEDFKDMDPYI